MKVFSKKHIDDLVNEISLQKEQLDIFAGTPESPGGIRHKPSGLVYTVLKVGKDSKNGLHILCSRPGKKLIIPTSDFKNYERQ